MIHPFRFNKFYSMINQTSNLPSIDVKYGQVKHTGEKGKWEGERNREERIRGQREVALVEKRNGMGRNGR
jgi:hypothetical protein